MEALARYLSQFKKLRRAAVHGGAPHKPVLLLALCRLILNGTIDSPKIFITPDLVLEFKEVWSRLVSTPHVPTFSLPFYHMRSEPFWTLIPVGAQAMPQSMSSLGVLKRFVHGAQIDFGLYALLKDPHDNNLFQETLIKHYFPGANLLPFSQIESGLSIQNEILNEDPQQYELRIESLEKTMSIEAFEEEIFVRGGIFKKVVPRIYNYQCAISGMRIETTTNAQMIDACHIVPFAESKDDTISNGISLCPNLHRAFDRGLITITADYAVKVSAQITEKDSPYSIAQFDGRPIILPSDARYYPGVANLMAHGERWGFL